MIFDEFIGSSQFIGTDLAVGVFIRRRSIPNCYSEIDASIQKTKITGSIEDNMIEYGDSHDLSGFT